MKKILFLSTILLTFFCFFSVAQAADEDGDGVINSQDICPNTAVGASVDASGTTRGCSSEQKFLDTDRDGVVDLDDDFPNDADEQVDTDSDSIGNNEDTDDDGDTLSDIAESNTGWLVKIPMENLSTPLESNFLKTTVTSDPLKKDTDGDELFDAVEKTRGLDPRKKDTDGDGVHDNVDLEITHSNGRLSVNTSGVYSPNASINTANKDSDGDTVLDTQDICPSTPTGKIVEKTDTASRGCSDEQKTEDSDRDTIPNYRDPDSDADGLQDAIERNGWMIRIPISLGATTQYYSYTGSSDTRLLDSDADGLDDVEEYQKKLNPLDDDTDRDGVKDKVDQELTSIEGSLYVNAQGKYTASFVSESDQDTDGVTDDKDLCPGSAVGTDVYTSGSSIGCTMNQLSQQNTDADFDGVADANEPAECRNTPAAHRNNVGNDGCVNVKSFERVFVMGSASGNAANNLSIGGSAKGESRNVRANDKLQGFNENNQFIKTAIGGEKGTYNTLITIARDIKNLFYAIATIFFLVICLKLIFSGNTEEEVGNFKKGIIWITIGLIVMQIAYAFAQVLFDEGVSAYLGASLLEYIVYPLIALIQTLASIFFIAVAFFAFYRMITANGDEDKIHEAKNSIIYAIIGFMIVRFARAIVEAFYGHINCQSFSLGFLTINGEQCVNQLDISEGSNIIIDILNWMNGFVAIAVLLMILYSGAKVLLSAGDDEKLKNAKSSLLYIAIGIGVLIMNYLILTFFLVPESAIRF